MWLSRCSERKKPQRQLKSHGFMRIAYLCTTPFPTEKANALQSIEMAKALAKNGADIDFFFPVGDRGLSTREVEAHIYSFYKPDLPFTLMPCRILPGEDGVRNKLRLPLLMRRAVNGSRYSYYYIRSCYLLWAAVGFNVPIVYEEHQWDLYRSPLKNKLARRLTLAAARQRSCKLFICISEELRRRWIRRGLPPRKAITAHDAVDTDLFSPVMTRADARGRLGISNDGVIVTYLGSLYENRGISDILWAAGRMPDVAFRLIGGPNSQTEKYRKIAGAKGLNNVSFPGRVARKVVPIHLFASDVLVFTMNEHTLTFDICSPMKIFEYLAAGRLIVAPDLPSMREVLEPSFSLLYIFPHRDSLLLTLKKAVGLANRGLAEERGSSGRAVVEGNYTWGERARRILLELKGNGGPGDLTMTLG